MPRRLPTYAQVFILRVIPTREAKVFRDLTLRLATCPDALAVIHPGAAGPPGVLYLVTPTPALPPGCFATLAEQGRLERTPVDRATRRRVLRWLPVVS